MTPAEEDHLARIKLKFYSMVDAKFRRGAEEHKDDGPLETLSEDALIDHAIEEAIDQVTFLFTLKEKRKK